MTRVLIVDDIAANREYLTTLLDYSGYAVSEATDGAEALERTRGDRPDAVIADVLMPTMDGYEFVRRLREDPVVAHTPVVFCTAVYHEQEARQLAESCGVYHVLTKPCEPEDVLRTLETALQENAGPSPRPDEAAFRSEHLRVVSDKLTQTIDELGLANERFGALIDINLKLASELNPAALIDGLCPAARSLIGARYGVLAVGGRGDPRVRHCATAGMDPGIADRLKRQTLDQGRIGAVYTGRRALHLDNIDDDPAALGLPPGHPPVQSVLAAPIVSLEHVYGWICLGDRIGSGGFTDEDEKLLTILAAQVGRVYENGDLYLDIQESEQRFRQLAENINEVFFLVEPGFKRALYVSPAYEEIWGRNVEDLYNDPREWASAIHPDDRDAVLDIFRDDPAAAGFDHEYRILRPDGASRWIHARGFPIRDPQGNAFRIAGIAEDITERRLAEDRIRRLNRVYAVLSGINSTIVRIRERRELFREACRILVEHGRFGIAWIGLLDEDTLAVEPAAWHGPDVDVDLLSRVRFSADAGQPGGKTSVGEAIRDRRPVAGTALELERDPGAVLAELSRRSYQRIISLPLLSSHGCLGVIVLCSKEPGVFDDEEKTLLAELAEDISFALDYIKNEERVEHLAYYDTLTDLPNRTTLYSRLVEVIEEVRSARCPCALVLMNINNFRDVNDSLGHQNGDRLLREIAGRIDDALFESDVVACLGGDEFAILLPSLAAKGDVNGVVQKIKQALEAEFVIEGLPINVEARLGVALYPDHGDSADLLWQRADIALRAARDRHRSWTLYEPGSDHYDPGRLALIGGLRAAMERSELELHYQPIIDLQTGHARGVEALLRWNHPDKGMLFPDQFLPMVERTGLINALTSWVLGAALHQGRAWHGDGLALDVSVNISVRNLQNPKLCGEILEIAAASGFPIDQLRLEITESAIMADPEHARSVLRELSDAGIHLSVDDFGIGQSSLAYIRDLPVHGIKIDKSFLLDFDQPRNAAIVSSAIDLGRNLKLNVIAEGVEDAETLGVLRELGCDAAQGYYFSRPAPVETITSWLRESPRRFQPD